MKFQFILILFIVLNISAFSQAINKNYFPENNEIDDAYFDDMQKWTTNYEWEMVVRKYYDKWQKQMILEMNRLISVIPEQKNIILKSQKMWQDRFDMYYSLIKNNINPNKVGREPYITWFMDQLEEYRQRSKYYFTLYYTIVEQKEDNFDYKQKFVLAKSD